MARTPTSAIATNPSARGERRAHLKPPCILAPRGIRRSPPHKFPFHSVPGATVEPALPPDVIGLFTLLPAED